MRFIFLVFSVIYVFSATELHEALKLPLLIQHYKDHKKENKNLSFMGFLKIHYSDEKTVYPDYEKDMKLPYKSDDKNILTLSFFSFKNIHFKNIHLPEIKSIELFPSLKDFILEGFQINIWQPPKNNFV